MLDALAPITLNFLAAGNPLDHVVDQPLVKTSGGWWILTNHMVMILLAAGLMMLVFPRITKRYQAGKAPFEVVRFIGAAVVSECPRCIHDLRYWRNDARSYRPKIRLVVRVRRRHDAR